GSTQRPSRKTIPKLGNSQTTTNTEKPQRMRTGAVGVLGKYLENRGEAGVSPSVRQTDAHKGKFRI
ncbi:hypothetical protein, partial [Brucella sp. 22210]|uniref:hypothetical protein n=1 Tax=Brucella sp. 22210 TaxID=3453892 RepID=UPI003F8253B1